MKVFVDQDKCIGSGQCVLAAPDVFDQRDEDGIAFVVTSTPPTPVEEDVHHAAKVCPALAIDVEE